MVPATPEAEFVMVHAQFPLARRLYRSRWANAFRSPAQKWQAASPRAHCSSKTSILALLANHSLCAGSRPRLLDQVSDPAAGWRAARENQRPADLCVPPTGESAARTRQAIVWPALALPLWLGKRDAGEPFGERVLCVKQPEAGPNCVDALAPFAHPFPGAAKPSYRMEPRLDTITPWRPDAARKPENRHIPRRRPPNTL
jgi:hypothetical protein